jgi:formylglycine-generating enzyme
LKARGVPVWLDQWDIRAGADWNKSIDEAIGACATFLVVLSPAAVDSKEVQGEWLTALDEHKLIVPVLCQACRIPRQLRVFQYVDFTAQRPADEATLNQVVRVLHGSGVVLPESQNKSPTELPAAGFSWRTALLALGVLGLVLVVVLYVSAQRRQKEERRLVAEALQAEEARQKAAEQQQAEEARQKAAEQQQAEEARQKVAEQQQAEEAARSQAAMVRVQAGEFWMGCVNDETCRYAYDEKPGRNIFVDTYAIDQYEVTVAEYRRCVKAGKCSDQDLGLYGNCNWNERDREDHPINCVTWDQAIAYCQWVGKRLPTEAEWEKAARAGSATVYSFGNDPSRSGEYAWYNRNRKNRDDDNRATRPVGQLKPNDWGLYDVHGNVSEWVYDRYASDYYEWGPNRNPKGPNSGDERVVRGDNWIATAEDPLSHRKKFTPGDLFPLTGFRCARSVEEKTNRAVAAKLGYGNDS